MMSRQVGQMNWPVAAVLAAFAAALGFGAAHWMASRNTAAAAPIAAVVPAPADSGPGDEIRIPAEYLPVARIAVEPVASGGARSEILATGAVRAAPNGEAVIVSRAAGNITRILRQPGDTVKTGDVLAQVESTEAAAMAAERNTTRARADLARKTFEREASLFEQGVTPRQDMETAQAALAVADAEARRAALVARAANISRDGASIAVTSPIAGTITARMATLGGFVQPQMELFRVAGGGQPLIEVSLPAADLRRVAAGDKATIIPASGTPVEATVRSVTPTVSGAARTALVLLTPVAGNGRLVVGEGVQARLHVKDGSAGMIVPEDAVQNIDGRDVLFVRTKDGFRPTPVLVGTRSGGVAQIVQGVKAGERVATRNAFLIKADMIKSGKEE